MDLKFLPESTGLDVSVSVVDAITALCADPHRTLPQRPKLIACFSPQASLEKVKNELRDLLTVLFTYHEPSLRGDFDWSQRTEYQAEAILTMIAQIDDRAVDSLHIVWEQSPAYTGPRVSEAPPELRMIRDFLSRETGSTSFSSFYLVYSDDMGG